jgi:hypothetical protein
MTAYLIVALGPDAYRGLSFAKTASDSPGGVRGLPAGSARLTTGGWPAARQSACFGDRVRHRTM